MTWSRRRALCVVAATCVVGAGALTGAYAAAPTATSAAHDGAAQPNIKLPPPPPGDGWTKNGLTVDKSEQTVKKAKLTFNFPELTALAWTNAALEQPPVPPQWANSTSYVYVTSPKGSSADFGVFPVKQVTMLAFGALPVTADVHVTQITKGKKIVPLTVTVRFTFGFVADAPTSEPCSTAQGASGCFYTEQPHMTGPVDIRIDNVKVDGQPLDVGPDCHTAEPATLDLSAPAGYYGQVYFPPNLYLPFANGGTLSGAVAVPSFTNCHNGSEDLDPILSGMVSGPGNKLTVHQKGPLGPYPPPKSSS